ncbi:hypothetical protein ACJX0J_019218, partial [Zea mays]
MKSKKKKKKNMVALNYFLVFIGIMFHIVLIKKGIYIYKAIGVMFHIILMWIDRKIYKAMAAKHRALASFLISLCLSLLFVSCLGYWIQALIDRKKERKHRINVLNYAIICFMLAFWIDRKIYKAMTAKHRALASFLISLCLSLLFVSCLGYWIQALIERKLNFLVFIGIMFYIILMGYWIQALIY